MSNVYFIYFVGFLIKKEFKVALSEIKVPESTLELVKKHVLVPFNSTSTPKGNLLFGNFVPLILICLLLAFMEHKRILTKNEMDTLSLY